MTRWLVSAAALCACGSNAPTSRLPSNRAPATPPPFAVRFAKPSSFDRHAPDRCSPTGEPARAGIADVFRALDEIGALEAPAHLRVFTPMNEASEFEIRATPPPTTGATVAIDLRRANGIVWIREPDRFQLYCLVRDAATYTITIDLVDRGSE